MLLDPPAAAVVVGPAAPALVCKVAGTTTVSVPLRMVALLETKTEAEAEAEDAGPEEGAW